MHEQAQEAIQQFADLMTHYPEISWFCEDDLIEVRNANQHLICTVVISHLNPSAVQYVADAIRQDARDAQIKCTEFERIALTGLARRFGVSIYWTTVSGREIVMIDPQSPRFTEIARVPAMKLLDRSDVKHLARVLRGYFQSKQSMQDALPPI